MRKRVGKEVSVAAADAVGMAGADIIAAYPITPQTHIVEHLAELVAEQWQKTLSATNTDTQNQQDNWVDIEL